MKKIFLLLALFATMFVACSDDDDDENDDGKKSENVVKVGEKTYKVYGIDAYYLQVFIFTRKNWSIMIFILPPVILT